jgi:DNA-directed RNA polymerase II subunit RPB7
MYFHMLLKKDVVIFPKDFGPNMQQRLIDKLIEKVEGSCSGRYGFVICVTEVVTLGKGKIREGGRLRPCRYCCCCARALARHLLWLPATFAGAGVVMFQMSFNAIVFRPFKGEALDAIVKSVNKMGFFAEVGPLDVFVSKHLIPADMSFDPQSNPAAWARPHQIDAHVEAALLQRELRCRALSS